jgi:tRNA dimethylallyltransferase
MTYNYITILGPTATGKTRLAAQLAHELNGEIISADSRQVYRGMNIGTGKDRHDYIVNNKKVKYHLIDIIDPSEEYNLFLFIEHFKSAFNEILSKKKIPFLVGGTGLYLNSILQQYKLRKAEFYEQEYKELAELSEEELTSLLLQLKPKLHNKTDLAGKERIIKAILVAKGKEKSQLTKLNLNPLVIGVKLERDEIRNKITERLKKRLDEGMIDEVRALVDSGVSLERLINLGLEYKFIALHLKDELNYEEMFQKLNTAIHQFAKRQMTWFRKMEREGAKINWIDGPDFNKAIELIKQHEFMLK